MTSIRLMTEIPGPRSRELAAMGQGLLPRAVSPSDAIFVASGRGAVVEDVDGNCFIDLTAGVGCLSVGHSHPAVLEAIRAQSEKFVHTDFSVAAYEPYLELAEGISKACGGGRKVALFNSGAEAVENAVKVARAATGHPGVVCFDGAFHGRTLLTMTLTSREVPIKRGFGPFAPEVFRIPYPNLRGATTEASINALEDVLGGHSIAAVIVEPMLGEGGFVVPPPDFLPSLADRCRVHGVVLIADEIQTGYGRTGTFLACEQAGVEPDLILLGKSIAAGLPLSAVVGKPGVIDAPEPHALGGTYVGNPVACAAGVAVLKVLDEEKLLERAAEIGELLNERWQSIAGRTGGIREVRGLGSMVGVEFYDRNVLARLIESARSRGVLALTAGAEDNVLRHLVPLVITDAQLQEALSVLETCITERTIA
jgi:4-aminobutyrate aminotransferase / (S)-3-amino-2-methylpropionate transaminase / 5-aminovalerate transaminase